MKPETKKDIRSLSLEDLRLFFTENHDQAFRGNQVYQWLWQKGIHNFEGMTNLSKSTRSLLETHFVINHIDIDQLQKSNDGTIKNAVKLHDNLVVESRVEDWDMNQVTSGTPLNNRDEDGFPEGFNKNHQTWPSPKAP